MLTRNGVVFSWGPEQHASFETLRQSLCEAPVLALPEGVEDFLVYCDASILGLGVVMMQRGHVIACTSRQLKPHKAKYPTPDLELGCWFSPSRFSVTISMVFGVPSKLTIRA